MQQRMLLSKLGWIYCLIPLHLSRWLQVLCLSPTLLSLELVPRAGSGGADRRCARVSALLVQSPVQFQLTQGTGKWLDALLVNLTVVAVSEDGPEWFCC